MRDYVRDQAEPSPRIRLKLAQILIQKLGRPMQGLRILGQIPEGSLPEKLETIRRQLAARPKRCRRKVPSSWRKTSPEGHLRCDRSRSVRPTAHQSFRKIWFCSRYLLKRCRWRSRSRNLGRRTRAGRHWVRKASRPRPPAVNDVGRQRILTPKVRKSRLRNSPRSQATHEECIDRQGEARGECQVGDAARALAHRPEVGPLARRRRHERRRCPAPAGAGDRIAREDHDDRPGTQHRRQATSIVPGDRRVVGQDPTRRGIVQLRKPSGPPSITGGFHAQSR